MGASMITVRAVPLSKEERKELKNAVPIYNAHSTRYVALKCRLKTQIRQAQQSEAGIVELMFDLVQKSTGKVITRKAMTEADASRKNSLISGCFWRRVGY